MQTPKERIQLFSNMINDPDLKLTAGELIRHTYFYVRYEWAITTRNVAQCRIDKYEKLLNANIDAYAFRKELNDL